MRAAATPARIQKGLYTRACKTPSAKRDRGCRMSLPLEPVGEHEGRPKHIVIAAGRFVFQQAPRFCLVTPSRPEPQMHAPSRHRPGGRASDYPLQSCKRVRLPHRFPTRPNEIRVRAAWHTGRCRRAPPLNTASNPAVPPSTSVPNAAVPPVPVSS